MSTLFISNDSRKLNIQEIIKTASSVLSVLALQAGTENTEVNKEMPVLRLLSSHWGRQVTDYNILRSSFKQGSTDCHRENRAGGRRSVGGEMVIKS